MSGMFMHFPSISDQLLILNEPVGPAARLSAAIELTVSDHVLSSATLAARDGRTADVYHSEPEAQIRRRSNAVPGGGGAGRMADADLSQVNVARIGRRNIRTSEDGGDDEEYDFGEGGEEED